MKGIKNLFAQRFSSFSVPTCKMPISYPCPHPGPHSFSLLSEGWTASGVPLFHEDVRRLMGQKCKNLDGSLKVLCIFIELIRSKYLQWNLLGSAHWFPSLPSALAISQNRSWQSVQQQRTAYLLFVWHCEGYKTNQDSLVFRECEGWS